MKITKEIFAFSDTHGRHRQMTIPEETQILICVGDAVDDQLDPEQYKDFLDWFGEQPGRHKIYVPGDSELIFDLCPDYARQLFKDRDITIALDEVVECDVTTFYCLRGPEIPEEGLQKMKETDYFVTHYPVEDLLPDVKIFPNAIIHGHDHGMGPAVCINSSVPIWNVSRHSRLFPEEYPEE